MSERVKKMSEEKPFPWKCGKCRERTVEPATVDYSTTIEHDGRAYEVSVLELPVARCQTCGEIVLDDDANRRISETFRAQLGLLTPARIRQSRERLGLTRAAREESRCGRGEPVSLGNRRPDSATRTRSALAPVFWLRAGPHRFGRRGTTRFAG